MNLQTDAMILENMETAVIMKNDNTTINKLETINRELETAKNEVPNVFHQKMLATQIAFNKMIIKRLQKGKY
ncbi:MAG: hypothetical protein EOP42_31005 [Sphingobacteriaceae bacterium]|nr:MAG: hypothetical protein EOP42_31005 [Sphingobacteriaceae bacterium]